MKKYVLFGAGTVGKDAIEIIGESNVEFIMDNAKDKEGNEVKGIKIYTPETVKERLENYIIVIAVRNELANEMEDQLKTMGLMNYIRFGELKIAITKQKILNRPDYIKTYKKAINWIYKNTVPDEGIINNSDLRKSYPEVSGYYIPTLIRWGHKELAIQYAKWLLKIQKEDGSWYDTEDKMPYVFDSAQILKGLLAAHELLPAEETDTAIIKGCDWILSNMQPDGRLVAADKTAWGTGRTITELIHLYCLSPLVEAGVLFKRDDYIEKVYRILEYYKTNFREEIIGFYCLSHFYAYIMEALLDMGEKELAAEAMNKVAKLQDDNGMVPAYGGVHWVCSTGLFQLALVWFRLGDAERGNAAFSYACKLQNESGGWFGSYVTEKSDYEENDYFPTGEISWANKYFLDALYYKNSLEFDLWSDTFLDKIDKNDNRYKAVKKAVEEHMGGRILDVGCGKGRYLKNLMEDIPSATYYGVDLSEKVMKYIDAKSVTLRQGSLCNIPYEGNYFDVVYTCEALEHAVDIEAAIKELARVTKSGGEIIIIDKDIKALGTMEIEEWEQWFDEDDLKNELGKYCRNVESESCDEIDGMTDMFRVWKGEKG